MHAYYLFSYNLDLPGVNVKIIDKVISLNKVGLKVKGLVLYNNKAMDLNFLPDEYFEKYYFSPAKNNYKILKSRFLSPLNSFIDNLTAVKELYWNILAEKQMSLLITRYGNSDYSSLWLMKQLKGNVVYESNTIELEQMKLKYNGLFRSPLWISYDYLNEKYFGPLVLRKVKGVVCVTDEIKLYQQRRIGERRSPKVVTISNGINVTGYKLAEVKRSDSTAINMIMLLGVDAQWNGLDKVARALKNTSLDVNLYVVGKVNESYKSDKILFCGQLNSEQTDKLITDKKIVAGIGTLALERKGIKEAAPLKVREYLSRGLPVVYSYHDTDIDTDPEFRDNYCVKLNYGSENIDLDFIIERVKAITSSENYQQVIREFALKNVDVASKALQYKKLIEELTASND